MTDIVFAFDRETARSKDADGRMRVKNCILSTAEINPYRGCEIPTWRELGLDANRVYELYRDPDELARSAATFEGVPLMIKHVAQTADAPRKEYQAGSVHSISFDGKHLRGDLLVSDGYAIDLIESGELADLSCGYRYTPVMESGTRGGDPFDGVMRHIAGNHVALVDDGRATGAHVADRALKLTGANDMAFPPKDDDDKKPDASDSDTPSGAAAPTPANGTQAANPPASQDGDPQDPDQENGAAVPPAGDPGPGAANSSDMAAIGQGMKHMAGLLEQLLAKLGGPAGAPVVAPGALDADLTLESPVGMITLNASEGERDPLENNGEEEIVERGVQNGTGARGGPTPHGAMDSASVKGAIETAVKKALAAERARVAGIEQARRDVRGVMGDIAMDNAGDIYRAALEQVGADVRSVPKGGERAAWDGYRHGAQAAAGVRPQLALDSNAATRVQDDLRAKLAKISVQG